MNLIRNILAPVRVASFIVITLSAAILYMLFLPFGAAARRFFSKIWWARGCCFVFGMNNKVTGTFYDRKPCLFVSNHLSYLDIVAIGSALEVSFAAKAEMKSWPFLGTMTRLSDTLFVSRNPRDAKEVIEDICAWLKRPHNLILFPEGTSWDGSEIKPFKSSAFSVIDDEELRETLHIQPLSIAYVPKKTPEQTAPSPFAWCKGYPLWKHIFESAARGGAEVRIVAYEPVAVKDFSSRKALTQHCFDVIEQGYFKSIDQPVKKYDPATDPTLQPGAVAAAER